MYRVRCYLPAIHQLKKNYCFHNRNIFKLCETQDIHIFRNELHRRMCHLRWTDLKTIYGSCYFLNSKCRNVIPSHTTVYRQFTKATVLNSENVIALNEETVSKTCCNSGTKEKFICDKTETWCVSYDPATLAENIYDTSLTCLPEEEEKKSSKLLSDDKLESDLQKKKKKKIVIGKSEELKKDEKNRYFARSLKSYIQVCGNANMNMKAHECLMYYRYKNQVNKAKTTSIDIDTYNALLNCWAAVGNLELFTEVTLCMAEDGLVPNLQSHVAHLECLSKCKNLSQRKIEYEVEKIAYELEVKDKSFSSLLKECIFKQDQLEQIEMLLGPKFEVDLKTDPKISNIPYSCKLLEKLNDQEYERSTVSPYISNCFGKNDIAAMTAKQMKLETDYTVNVKSVSASETIDEKTVQMRKLVENCEENFKQQISSILDVKLDSLFNDVEGNNCMSLYPYFHVIEKDILVRIMLQEIRWIISSAEFFSPSIRILCQNIGTKVMNHYLIWLRRKNGVTDKISYIYLKYLEYVLTPELSTRYSPREYWEFLKKIHFKGPTIDVSDVMWPHHVSYEVGKFLYGILLQSLSFNVNIVRPKSKKKMMVPPFYTIYERSKKEEDYGCQYKSSLQIRAHPRICKLYSDADLVDLQFDVTMIPMLCPPRPWTRLNAGGLLMTSIPFIRLPLYAHQHNAFYDSIPNKQLYPCFDSLNNLSLCPWIINKPVLDLIIEVFRNNGCEDLDIPLNPNVHFNIPEIKSTMTDEEKKVVRRQRAIMKKKKLEATSLWFACLYKLSIANQFRDEIFWFPHNLDFRGRVYPTPPHFNHLGSDLVRSILLFAEGKPLGENGLDWLKIHLINLTGFKKREPNDERLRYANEVMSEILDSADKPFTGNKWWQTSDEPWQTLACCMEVARAIRSPDSASYVSQFPVHQDGSCNGLQHYAALGRDEYGAKEVNLFPSDRPQDVYSAVAALVEEERRKDAAKGNEVAAILSGFVKRKVVKRTIMTFVYGVTEYGAKQQILKQLKDIDDFPDKHSSQAAHYLMKQTFCSIQKMFTATREIQKWFTDCAELITRITGEPVEWITPLGLPVVQPYHKKASVRSLTEFVKADNYVYSNSDTASYTSTYEKYQPPNIRKQKNAFAPNFIHSLDSSHMMLTSLFCQRKGITFVSVHDCYWTHPANVKIMNEICRQQFVSLHREPVLENLSEFFLKNYGNCELSDENGNRRDIEKLKVILGKVPEKGTFELKHVLDSVYFFS